MPKLEQIKEKTTTMRWLVEKHPLTILLLFSALIRIIYLSLQNPLWWDSYIYIGIGKFFLSQGSAGLFELFRPPLHPLLLGSIWKLGINPLIAGIIIDIVLSLTVVYLTYTIGTIIFERKTAFLAALITSITPVFLLHTGLILTEPLAMTLSLTAVYFLITHRSPLIVGLLVGLSVLAKFPQGIILAALLIFIFCTQKLFRTKIKKSALCLSGFLLIIIPYLYINNFYFHDLFAPLKAGSWIVTTATWLYGTGISYYFIHFFLAYPLFLFFFVYLYFFVADGIKNKKIEDYGSALILLISIITIGYFLTVQRKEPRYLVVIVPYIALLSMSMARRIYLWLLQQKKPVFHPTSFITVCIILGIAFIPGPLTFERSIYPTEINTVLANTITAAPIISSNPVPAAFTDSKIFPLSNMEFARIVYNDSKSDADFLLLTDCDLICAPNDASCEHQKKEFIQTVTSENRRIFHKTIKSCTTSLFELQHPPK